MGAVDTRKEETHNKNNEFYEVRSCEASYFLIKYNNSTHTHKFNDYRNKRKLPLRISHCSGTFFISET